MQFKWGLRGLLATLVALVACYLWTEFRFNLQSDDAVRSVLAHQANMEGSLLVKNWVYANGDLFIASPYSVNVFLDRVVGDAFLANALSSFVGYLLMLACFHIFCRSIEWKYESIPLLSTAFLASGISEANLEFTSAQGIYSIYTGLALLAVVPLIRRAPVFSLYGVVGAAAASLLALSNPKRAAVVFILPFLVAWVLEVLVRCQLRQTKTNLRDLLPSELLLVLVGFLVGSVIYYMALLPQVMNMDAAASGGLSTVAEMADKVLKLPGAWGTYLQPQLYLDQRNPGQWTIAIMAGFIAIALLLGPAIALTGFRQMSESKRFGLFFAFALLVVGIAAMIAGKNLFFSFPEIRYLSIAIACLAPFSLETMGKYLQRLRLLSIACGGFVAYLLAIAVIWSWPDQAVAVRARESYENRLEMIDKLRQSGICTVLSSYWNSYTNSVADNFTLPFYPVEFADSVRIEPHHSYRGHVREKCDRSALLLSQKEDTQALEESARVQFGASQRLVLGDKLALVYGRNIYDKLLQDQVLINEKLAPEKIAISLSRNKFSRCNEDAGCKQEIKVSSHGSAVLASNGVLPVRLGIHGLDRGGKISVNDMGRVDFVVPLHAGDTETLIVTLPRAPENVEQYQLCVMQEGVSWHCDRTSVDP